MKKYCLSHTTYVGLLSFLCSTLLLLNACKEEKGASLFDPNAKGQTAPTIDSITSSTPTSLAGVSVLTLTGKNFSTNNADNIVYFESLKQKLAVKAVVRTSAANKITVTTPSLVDDSVLVKATVTGAQLYSNTKVLKIEAAVLEFGGLTPTEEAIGLACDTVGNVYGSIVNIVSGGIGIRRMFSVPGVLDTSRELYAPTGGFKQFQNLKMGPNNVLYGLRLPRILYTIAAKGATPVVWAQVSGASLYDFDFSKSGGEYYIWTGGNDTAVYRIKLSDKSVQSYPFTGQVRSVRVYNNSVYLAAKVDSTEGVWQFPITASNDLGPATKYFDLSAQPGYGYNGPEADAITFNTDGDMYLGTSSADAILLVHSNKSYEVFYSGLLLPKPVAFAWGKGSYLYYSRGGDAAHIIVKINTLKTSAPYFGRGDQ